MLVYLHQKESDCWDWIVYANRWQHFSVGHWHNIIQRCGIGLVPRRLPSCEGLVGGILMSSSAESQRQWRKCIHLRLVDDVNVDHFTCYQTFPVKWILEFILYWVPTKLTARCYPLSIELAVSPKGETCVFNWRAERYLQMVILRRCLSCWGFEPILWRAREREARGGDADRRSERPVESERWHFWLTRSIDIYLIADRQIQSKLKFWK